MTENRFFRVMTVLPLIVPILAGAISVLRLGPLAVQSAAFYIAMAGVYGAIPYLVFLAILFTVIRPSSRPAWNRTLWVSPLLIAICFALTLAILGWMGGTSDVVAKVWLWGELALVTGYGYAIVIWICSRWRRWSRRPPDTSSNHSPDSGVHM